MASKPYKRNFGLFLTWHDDGDASNGGEEFQKQQRRLRKVLQGCYNFIIEEWPIPNDNSYEALNTKLSQFLKKGGSEDSQRSNSTLLLVYYGGHAIPHPADAGDLFLVPRPNAPTKNQVSWRTLMVPNLLSMKSSDALLLLDCCYASRAYHSLETDVHSSINSVALLAATTDDAQTPIDGEQTFTKNMGLVLKEFYDLPSLTIRELYGGLSVQACNWRRGRGKHEQSCIPVPLLCRPSKTQDSPMAISKFSFDEFDEATALSAASSVQDKTAKLITLSAGLSNSLDSDSDWDNFISLHNETIGETSPVKPEQSTPAPQGIYNQFDPHDNMMDTGDPISEDSGGGFWSWLASRPKPTRPYSPPPAPSAAFDLFSPDAGVDNNDIDNAKENPTSTSSPTSSSYHHSSFRSRSPSVSSSSHHTSSCSTGPNDSDSLDDTTAPSSSTHNESTSEDRPSNEPESFSFLSQWD